MISIVICHINEELLLEVKKNVHENIGTPYEFIVIDNTESKYTIFEAYNIGAATAKYSIVCFMHEDVLYYTKDWGLLVVNHFNDCNVGMIGVVGGKIQSDVPSSWWYNDYTNTSARNLLMRREDGKLFHHFDNPNFEVKAEVIIIDGLWFCIRKDLFQKVRFDEKLYKGFHLYDADISLQIAEFSKLYVVYDILIEHRWKGTISSDYISALQIFINKWAKSLPRMTDLDLVSRLSKFNVVAVRNILVLMKEHNHNKSDMLIYKNEYIKSLTIVESIWYKLYFLLERISLPIPLDKIFLKFEIFLRLAYKKNNSFIKQFKVNN